MSFETAIEFTLSWEGGYHFDPNDPGSETNFGISKKSYPALPIKALTQAEAQAIYRKDYWDRLALDRFPPAIGIALFDTAVNLGRFRATSFLQRAAKVYEDGMLGPETLKAVGTLAAPALLIEYLARRAAAYALMDELDDFFALGWYRRLLALHQLCLAQL